MSVHPLRIPPLSARPFGLLRSEPLWLRRSGDRVQAREPLALCHLGLSGSRERHSIVPLAEDHDLQVVLASPTSGTIESHADLSRGSSQHSVVDGTDWDPGTVIGSIDAAEQPGDLVTMVLAGRRGFESGEGRGGLLGGFLAGWHERARAFWQGEGTEPFGTVLSLGTCEQTAIFRGEDMAFLSWFARAPGPAQVVVAAEHCVHSSAVLLQHIRRTPSDALAITAAVQGWFGEHAAGLTPGAFPAFEPEAARGYAAGRWPEMQDLLFALHLLGNALGTCPILERSDVLTRRGFVQLEPADAIVLSLGSEFALHFRHRRAGWMIAIHGFRFGRYVGPRLLEWLRRDFEPVPRTISDIARDLTALAGEVSARTGKVLLVQNLIASSALNRISNYAWLGESFSESPTVMATEANLMLCDVARAPNVSMIDSDALAADLGVRHVPDGAHASRALVEAQRCEYQRVLRARGIAGF
jgi:hypothetical protein